MQLKGNLDLYNLKMEKLKTEMSVTNVEGNDDVIQLEIGDKKYLIVIKDAFDIIRVFKNKNL